MNLGQVDPPGTIRIKNIYIDKMEIQNIHWLEYMYYASQELDSMARRGLWPDSANFWFEAPSRKNEPVVFISYEQAMEYCAWRSKVVSKGFGRRVTYRLPTEQEWIEVARELLRIDERGVLKDVEKTIRKLKGKSGEYKVLGLEDPKDDVHNFFDNVSEMMLEKGLAKGSNNLDVSTDLVKSVNQRLVYDKPNAYVGFRCVAEVEER
jgi:formylglycine-generating enzyme required for sulfatase activity